MERRDRLFELFRERTLSRLFAIGVFLGLLFLFRHLWALFIFFIAFERSFGFICTKVTKLTGWPRKRILIATLVLFLLLLGGGVAFGAMGAVRGYHKFNENAADWLSDLKEHPLYTRVKSEFGDAEKVMEGVHDYAGRVVTYATAIGRFFMHALVGFIFAVVYMLEREELEAFGDKIDPHSLIGRILRWFSHVADSISVTMQLQLVVAVFNTVTTLPVLIALGIPHIPSLMALIFVSALVPVVGNLVTGVVLCLLAYQAKGWVGVGIFLVVTFVLHKIESYYLSPRLTAKHVRVPGFVLISSLILFEHLFGFAGVFLSFPALFVAGRIRAEFREEDGLLPPQSVRPGQSLAPGAPANLT